MRLFVTGGTGFVGSHLVPLLKERGHEVVILNRRNSDHLETILSDFKPEGAFHLAWEGLPDYSWPVCVKNIGLGLKVYESLLHNDCRKIITTGTCWEYGTMNTFAAAKTGLRLMGEALAREKGTSFIWARLFFIYGPGQRETSLIPSVARQIKNKQRPEIKNPNACHDFIYVKDVAQALALLAESNLPSKIVNVGSGQLYSVNDIAQCVLKIMSGEAPPPCLSRAKSRDKGRFGGVDSFWADISDLERLSWKPEYDLAAGIRDTLQNDYL